MHSPEDRSDTEDADVPLDEELDELALRLLEVLLPPELELLETPLDELEVLDRLLELLETSVST